MLQLSSTLTRLMADKGIKSAELARKIGIGQPVIHRLMSGVTDNPQVQTLLPIAQYFGVTIDQLLGRASLDDHKILDSDALHSIKNQLATVKIIAGVVTELLPALIDGYLSAVSAELVEKPIAVDMFPLLTMNVANLLNVINQLQASLTTDKI